MVLLLKTILSRSSSCASRAADSSSSIFQCLRWMSNVPESTVYGGPKPQNPNRRVTLTNLRQKHRKGEPITVVTAYDYPSAVHLNEAGINVCIVGDSASMVVHGHDTTLAISLEEMLMHCLLAVQLFVAPTGLSLLETSLLGPMSPALIR